MDMVIILLFNLLEINEKRPSLWSDQMQECQNIIPVEFHSVFMC